MDCLRILNLKIPAKHGIYDFEKNKEGVFELDVEMFLDLNIPGKTDKIDDTINYDDVVNVVIKVFTNKDYNLIEAAGQNICNQLLTQFKLEKVIIRIRKPHAPINAEFDTVEVELIRISK